MKLEFKDTFDVKYKGKYLEGPKADINYSLETPEDAKTPEGKELEQEIKKVWEAKMKDLRAAQEKKFLEAIKATEKIVEAKNKTEKELKEFVETANIMLKKGVETMQSVVEKEAQGIYEKAVKKIAEKYKKAIRAQKIKAVLKIALFVGIILTAAAVSIAASVLTGGAAAPIIIGAVITGFGAIKKSYDTAIANWPSAEKALKNLETTGEALAKAVAYEEKKIIDEKLRTLGPKERLKRILGNVDGKKKDCDKAVKLCQTYMGKMKQDIEKLAQEQAKLGAEVEKMKALKAPALEAKINGAAKLQRLIDTRIETIRADVKKMQAAIDGVSENLAKEFDSKSLLGVVGKLKDAYNSDTVQTLKDLLGELGSALKDLHGAVAK